MDGEGKPESEYTKLLAVLGEMFVVDLRGAENILVSREPGGSSVLAVVVCPDYPGGFGLHLDESALAVIAAALQ